MLTINDLKQLALFQAFCSNIVPFPFTINTKTGVTTIRVTKMKFAFVWLTLLTNLIPVAYKNIRLLPILFVSTESDPLYTIVMHGFLVFGLNYVFITYVLLYVIHRPVYVSTVESSIRIVRMESRRFSRRPYSRYTLQDLVVIATPSLVASAAALITAVSPVAFGKLPV